MSFVMFVMPVRPSVHTEQLGSHCTDFHEILYLSIFTKICRENSSPSVRLSVPMEQLGSHRTVFNYI